MTTNNNPNNNITQNVFLIADKCGEYSLTAGYWDYCLYKDISKPDYLAMGWEEKTNEVMENVVAEPSPGNVPNVACKCFLNESNILYKSSVYIKS